MKLCMILTLIKTISMQGLVKSLFKNILIKQSSRHKVLTTLIKQSLITNMFQAFSVLYQSTFALGVAS